MTEVKQRSSNAWLPYVRNRVVLAANEEDMLYVKDDDVQGLGEPGRCGKIENLGLAGLLTYQISDDGDKFMDERTLNPGAWDEYYNEEKIKIHSIRVKADAVGTIYSVIMCAALPKEEEVNG